jgi:hypothetical protein
MAQSLSGAIEEAQITVAELMKLQPELTAALYRERHPSSAFRTGAIWADALKQAGVPD